MRTGAARNATAARNDHWEIQPDAHTGRFSPARSCPGYSEEMTKVLLVLLMLGATACGSDGSSGAANGGTSGSQSCPDLSGAWKIAKHCDTSLVGTTLTVMEKDCALTMAAPFDSFMGNVTSAGAITLSGPQSCTGTATETTVNMSCTPAPCEVVLGR